MFFLLNLYNILFIYFVYSYPKTNNKNDKLNEQSKYRNNSTFLDDEISNEIKSILRVPDKFELFTRDDIIKLSKKRKCKKIKNQPSVFFSSSITQHDIISSVGLNNGTVCSSCSDGYLTYFSPYKINRITKDSGPIVDISCLAGQNLCICDKEDICYTPNSKNISIMLYPICIKKQCNVYAILAGYKKGDALISLDNTQFFYSINQINFMTKEYWPFNTDGVYLKVKSIGCNGCNIKYCKKSRKYRRKAYHKNKNH